MVKGLIFDVDGTLLDSMGIWMDAGKRYLESQGCIVTENLAKVMFEQTMPQTAQYMIDNYGISYTEEEIIQGINNVVYAFYEKEAQPKEGVREFLEYMYSKSIPMTVATSTDRPMIEVALKRVGFDKYFKKYFTTSEVGKGKDHPLIFQEAMKEMGSTPDTTWMFEDALYSIKTAKALGLKVLGVYDFSSEEDTEQIRKQSDIYVEDWKAYRSVIELFNRM